MEIEFSVELGIVKFKLKIGPGSSPQEITMDHVRKDNRGLTYSPSANKGFMDVAFKDPRLSAFYPDNKTTLNYKTIPSPLWATNGLKKVSNIFHTPLGVGSDSKKITELQTLLQEVGMYNGKIDGIYNSEVIDAIYTFQKKNDIPVAPYSAGAGYWGATTRNTFFKQYINGTLTAQKQVIQENNNELELFEKPLN